MERLLKCSQSPSDERFDAESVSASSTSNVAHSHLICQFRYVPYLTKTDHLRSEDATYLIGTFRDDEDELIYKVLSIYK